MHLVIQCLQAFQNKESGRKYSLSIPSFGRFNQGDRKLLLHLPVLLGDTKVTKVALLDEAGRKTFCLL